MDQGNPHTKLSAYPLCWPVGWNRTKGPLKRGPYKVTFQRAYGDVQATLKMFRAFGVVISTDVPLRRDGQPYADGDPRDPAVAVYFTRGKQQYVIACDCWDNVRHNMRAVGLALDGLRSIERSGAAHILDRAFQGFAALPGGAVVTGTAARPWREVLNLDGLVGPDFAIRAAVEASFRNLSRTRHPDAGGTHESMVELTAARDAALRELGESHGS